jgi:glycosyltransferase involved in cell wall biosynthesis
MHILHVVQLYHPVKSGAGRYFEEIGARLVADGHRVTVLSTDAYDLEHFWMAGRRRVDLAEEWHRGMRIVRLSVQRMPGPPLLYPALRRVMAECSRLPGSAGLLRSLATLTPQLAGLQQFLATAGPFDLIHAGNITLDFAILPALAAARAAAIPFICTPFVHVGVPGEQNLVRYYTMRHQLELLQAAAAVGCMTTIEAEDLVQRGVRREQVHVIGAGVDPAEVAGGDRDRFRAEQQIAGPIVLYIGALARDKGAIDTVEAMRQLWAHGQEATLVLIGAPLAHFQHYYRQLPAADQARIRLLPYASDALKRDALAAADLFTLPSRTDSFGIVFLEAWCYGVPVVGARAGGIPGVISDGADGVLVPYGNPGELARALADLLTDPAKRQRFGAAGRAKVDRLLTWDHVYQRAQTMIAGLE